VPPEFAPFPSFPHKGMGIESFLKTISPFWKPHPGQKTFLLNQAKTKVLACGRRWGKSQVLAVQILFRLLTQPLSRQLLVAPTLEQAKMTLELVPSLLEKLLSQANLPTKFEIKTGRLPLLAFQDAKVLARSAKQGNNLRGNEATDLILDEAAFIPEPFIESILSPMQATTDG